MSHPVFRVIAGLVYALLSAASLVYLYAFSSMTDPRLEPLEWWREALGKMFSSFALWPAAVFAFGIYLIASGVIQFNRR